MKTLMKNKNVILVCLGVLLVIIVGCVCLFGNKTVKCTRNFDFVEGIKSSETVEVKLNSDKITDIKLDRKITLNDFYDSYGSYYSAIENVLKKSYDYLGKNAKIQINDKSINIKVNTKKDGLVLDNLKIYQNGAENTSLRYDGSDDLNSSSAIKINDKIKKGDLENKIKKLGYTCK